MILTLKNKSGDWQDFDSSLVDSYLAFSMQSQKVDVLQVSFAIWDCVRSLNVQDTDNNYCIIRKYLSDNGENNTGQFYINTSSFTIMRRNDLVENNVVVKDYSKEPCCKCGCIDPYNNVNACGEVVCYIHFS